MEKKKMKCDTYSIRHGYDKKKCFARYFQKSDMKI